MDKFLLILIFLSGVFLHDLAALEIAAFGKAKVPVVINAADITETEKNAAKELIKYLNAVTGAQFKLSKESDFKGESAIYLGRTTFAKNNQILPAPSRQEKEEWVIQSVNKSIVITGSRPRGVIYGVYDFLERYAEVYFLCPDGTSVKRKNRLEVPDRISIRKKPAFYWRYSAHQCHLKDGFDRMMWNLHSRLNYAYITDQYGGTCSYGSPGLMHTYYRFSKNFPPNHPELFSLKNGQRLQAVNTGGPGQICLTNPETRKLITEQLLSYIAVNRKNRKKNYPLIYSLTQNDNNDYCECDGCLEYLRKGGNYSDTTVKFINSVAADVEKHYPDVKILFFAYTYTLKPPKFEKPKDNVIVWICNLSSHFNGGISETSKPITDPRNVNFYNDFIGWSKISKEIFIWDYWTLYGKPLVPLLINTKRLFTDMQFFARNHVSGLLIEQPSMDVSFYDLRLFLQNQLMVDPFQDRNKLLNIFFENYYQEAAVPMRQYFDLLENAVEAEPGSLDKKASFEYLTRAFLDQADRYLDLAERKSDANPAVLKRIKRERISVDHARIILKYAKDRTAVINRLETNVSLLYKDSKMSNAEKALKKWASTISFLKLNIQPPEQFKNRRLWDFTWSVLPPADYANVKRVNDPDAIGGKTLRIGKRNQENTHRLPFQAGLYDRYEKTHGPRLALQKVPQDEKYHLYKIGDYNVRPGTSFWAPWSWAMQIRLDAANDGAPENQCEVYVSIKFTGPAYVKGSSLEDAVFIDRILIVKK